MPVVRRLAFLLAVLSIAAPAPAQYAETTTPLPGATNGSVVTAAQIGRRLFIGGAFSAISPPTGNAVVVTPSEDWPVKRFAVRGRPYHDIPDILIRDDS